MLLPITYDVGNLVVFDPNNVASVDDEDTMREHCRAMIGGLMERLLALPPVNHLESQSLRALPKPATALPRALPIPAAKPLTKWEKFAKRRGIQKRKKGALKFDDASEEWMARHGKRSAKNAHSKVNNWIKDWKAGDDNDFSD